MRSQFGSGIQPEDDLSGKENCLSFRIVEYMTVASFMPVFRVGIVLETVYYMECLKNCCGFCWDDSFSGVLVSRVSGFSLSQPQQNKLKRPIFLIIQEAN